MTKLIADIRSDIGRFRTGQDDTLNVENILDLCAEHEQLLVELAHRVGWEERCLDAEAAAARLERQNAELAREAIGAKAAWMDLQQNTRDLKDFIVVANERDALRAQNDQARELYAAMLAELNALRPVVDEVRKLEAIDHGVAWPDLCHALHELDRHKGPSI